MRQFALVAMTAIAVGGASLALAQTAPIDPPPSKEPPPAQTKPIGEETYSSEEILQAATGLFGKTSQGLAQVVEKVFAEQGRPNAYIAGEEGSGAFGVGLRYGKGDLHYKGDGNANLKVYWKGPSVGWDIGGNASKVFTLVYNLQSTQQLMQRYPGVDGSLYFLAGVGMNYQRSGDVTLAPIRTGVGFRAGANVGYLHYSLERSWIPF